MRAEIRRIANATRRTRPVRRWGRRGLTPGIGVLAALLAVNMGWAQQPNVVHPVTLRLGEPQQSSSEGYRLWVGERSIVSPALGTGISNVVYLANGEAYRITLEHVASSPYRLTDYDYFAAVECGCGIIEDFKPMLGTQGWNGVTGYFQAAGTNATLIIPRIDWITNTVVDAHPPREVPAPGDMAQLRAGMLPTGRASLWTLIAVEPDQPQGRAVVVTTNAVPNGVDMYVHPDSGSGWVVFLIQDSELSAECGIVYSVRVGCDSCGAPSAADASCASCGAHTGVCPFGDFDPGNGSVNMSFGVGPLGRERGGLIRLYADTPSTNLAKLTTLDFSAIWGSDIRRIGFTNALHRQLLVPHGLVDMFQDTDFKYTLRFYLPGDKGVRDDCTGYYQPNPGDSLRTYVVENLKITEDPNGTPIVTQYRYVPVGSRPTLGLSGWQLSTGNGLRTETRTPTNMPDGRERVITQVTNLQGRTSYHAVAYYGFSTGVRLLLEETLDPAGASNTTFWTYHDDPAAPGSYRRVASVLYPDGNWQRHQYDALGRLTNTVEAFKNAAPTAAADEAVEIRYAYEPLPDSDDTDASHDRFFPRRVERRVLGHTTRLDYTVYGVNGEGERMLIREQCLSADAEYGDTNNLRRVTYRYAPDVATPAGGRLKSITHPDGTRDTYAYELGAYTPDADPALSAFMPGAGTHLRTSVTRGTVANPAGVALRTTRTRTVEDTFGALLLSETEVYTGTGYERVDWTVTTYDALGRRVAVDHADGTREETEWACCGVEREVARDGQITESLYDALKRPTDRIRLGAAAGLTNDLFTSYTYDASGRVLLETRSGSGLSLVSSNAYDLAGRLVKQVDPAGLITTYAYAAGERFATNTLPGGATVATERYRDGRTRQVVGTGTIATLHDYGVNDDGTQWATTWTGPLGEDSPAWTRTVTDLLGRTIREERPGFGGAILTNAFVYDPAGRRVRATQTGRPDTLFVYDELGELLRSGLDVNGNSVLDLDGEDRIEASASGYEQDNEDDWWRVSAQVIYPLAGNAGAVTVAVQRARLTGLGPTLTAQTVTRDPHGNETVSTTVMDANSKTTTTQMSSPFSASNAITVAVNGLIISSTSPEDLTQTTTYDGLGRPIRVTVPRTGTHETVYDAVGRVIKRVDPAGYTNSFVYEVDTGWLAVQTNALGQALRYAYDSLGRVEKTWGDATYPVRYVYDEDGRIIAMHTYREESGWSGSDWPATPGTPDTTTWWYEPATGLLTNKLYADGEGTRYTYTEHGLLAGRTWARGVETTYTYTNTTGELLTIAYSDDTPEVNFAYDRLGRPVSIEDGQGLRRFDYDPERLHLSNETLVVGSVTNHLSRDYDPLGRAAGVRMNTGYVVSYAYDDLGRFASVTSLVAGVTQEFNYQYLPNSGLIAGVESGAFSVHRQYEPSRDLLSLVSNAWNGTAISTFAYVSEALGRRTQRIDNVAVTNAFGYNARSELVSAAMDTNSFTYGFDAIGNRTAVTNNAEDWTYLANALNQYTNIANGVTNSPDYDADGNLLTLGDWGLTWDGENRLVGMTNGVTDLTFAYDYMGRRIRKVVDGATNQFAYDGWAMIGERITDNGSEVTNLYVYGLDLSGTLQGAGTIGGILAASLSGAPVSYAYDANGNVTDLVNASGAAVAHYAYDPYGNVLTQSGALADDNPFRFSTKFEDPESGWLYYGYRFYDPELGRWLSRDPAEASVNLYAAFKNAPTEYLDALGLVECRSSGFAERDPWYGVFGMKSESGNSSSCSASLSHRANTIGSWTRVNRLCNSGGRFGPVQNTHVQIEARSSCPGRYRVACCYSYQVLAKTGPMPSGTGPSSTVGGYMQYAILGTTGTHVWRGQQKPTGEWEVVKDYTFCGPGAQVVEIGNEWQQLLLAGPYIGAGTRSSTGAWVGAEFHETLAAVCQILGVSP